MSLNNYHRKPISKYKTYKINDRIRYSQVRVIDHQGQNLGIMPIQQAQSAAQDQELDLVLITESANPPVVRIMDFNKFLYEERKKESKSKAAAKTSKVKEFKFRSTVASDRIEHSAKRAKEFIADGNKVKFTIQLQGRQTILPQVAYDKVKLFQSLVADFAKMETEPKRMGNLVITSFVRK